MKSYKFYPFITGIFTAALLISNTLDTKLFVIGTFAMPAGILLFPITYLFGDILTEVYGYAASRRVIWTGFISLILMVCFYELARIIPPAPFWNHQGEFATILGKVPRIVLASITAYFFGEFTNSYVLAKLKVKSGGKAMGFRFIVSTIFGQAVDTCVFVLIAFSGTMEWITLLSVFLSGWAFKVVWEVAMLPISIPVVKWLKKSENEDYFDRNTNFNPFGGMKNTVSKDEVSDFKRFWCDENPIIIDILLRGMKHKIIGTVLDVGSGLGDIASAALKENRVICIDTNPVSANEIPPRHNHIRIQADFFDFKPKEKIDTVLISHTLQFIDDDIDKLNKKIGELNPQHVITVTNDNNDFMGTLIEWTSKNFEYSNPEINIEGFPQGYHLRENLGFIAEVSCDTFEQLAYQVSYLMLVQLTPEKKEEMISFLKANLLAPKFRFNQSIKIYERNGK